MKRRSTFLVTLLAALLLAPAPIMAQDTGAKADGKFRLTLDGTAPENVSFWVEVTATGEGGVICTTDAAMVRSGIAECLDGGATNEMAFSAPAGSTIDYRVIGSQGSELSQQVVAEGSKIAEDGFVVDASYTFSGDPIGGAPSGTHPEETTPATDGDNGAAGDQYADESSSSGESSSGKDDTNAAPGLLPDTGGSPLILVAGAVLLLGAGGLLAYRTIR